MALNDHLLSGEEFLLLYDAKKPSSYDQLLIWRNIDMEKFADLFCHKQQNTNLRWKCKSMMYSHEQLEQ